MPRMTRRKRDEVVSTFYGINPKTFEVEAVYVTRGRELQKWGKDATYHSHQILGRLPRTEIVVVYGLTELIEFPLFHSEEEKQRKVQALEAKAAKMRADFEANRA
jgi:hypothetical protein